MIEVLDPGGNLKEYAGGQWVFSEKASFLEAKGFWLAFAESADDHMIKHVDLEYLGSFCESAGYRIHLEPGHPLCR